MIHGAYRPSYTTTSFLSRQFHGPDNDSSRHLHVYIRLPIEMSRTQSCRPYGYPADPRSAHPLQPHALQQRTPSIDSHYTTDLESSIRHDRALRSESSEHEQILDRVTPSYCVTHLQRFHRKPQHTFSLAPRRNKTQYSCFLTCPPRLR